MTDERIVWVSVVPSTRRSKYHARQDCGTGGADPRMRVPTVLAAAEAAGLAGCSFCTETDAGAA